MAFALLSIAEKALQEASVINSPLECWGCGQVGHPFGKCPRKNEARVMKQFKERLDQWEKEGSATKTPLLMANRMYHDQKYLGFHSQKQA